jgi:hypothetical protein
LFRFLLLAVLLTVLLIGICTLAFDAADGGRFGPRLDGKGVLGGWLLEATALTALFLLIQGRGGSWWLDGLLAGWLAWIFRGPVLLLTVAELQNGVGEPLWTLTLRWLLTYSLCGLLISLVARRVGVRR